MPNIINNLNSKYTLDKAKQFFALTAKDNPKDLIEIELGDSKDASKFFPQQKISRWQNECNVSIRLKDFDGFSIETETDKIKLITPEKEVHLYQIEEGEGASEFEIILNEKPKSNVMEFSIQDKDVDYFFQPKLTEQEILDGASRPPEVEESYAVYAKTPKTNWTGGKEYKTGKVGHIYRPQIIDAVGTKVWGELHIENGILSVTIPQEFLDKAVYPVRHAAGLTFGYGSAGASAQDLAERYSTLNYTSKRRGNGAITGAAGTLDKISAYLLTTDLNDSCDVTFSINTEHSGGASTHAKLVSLAGTYTGPTTATLKELTAASQTLTAVDYILNLWGDPTDLNSAAAYKYLKVACDLTGWSSNYYEDWTGTGAYTSAAEDPWTETESTSNGNKLSIYATYTPSLGIALTGTVAPTITEADVVAGGKTIILTLTGDVWVVAAGGLFDAQRQNIINGLDSAQAEANGWDAEVKAKQGVAGVVRTSDTVVTITLDAQAAYNITATETITATVPGTALLLGTGAVASPTFTVTATAAGTNMSVNIGDTFKTVESTQVNIADTWKTVSSAQVNVGDTWKTIF